MRLNLIVLLLIALINTCCYRASETPEKHWVHKGETAVLVESGRANAVMAAYHKDAHQVARAVDTPDPATVDRLVREGKALELPNGTLVKVLSESFNEREIRVIQGPKEGSTGWVPFEWLKPYVGKKL